jgi:hypothetical protein
VLTHKTDRHRQLSLAVARVALAGPDKGKSRSATRTIGSTIGGTRLGSGPTSGHELDRVSQPMHIPSNKRLGPLPVLARAAPRRADLVKAWAVYEF